MVYQDLIQQYDCLSQDDKNTLLIYKSRLSRAINSLDIDDNEIKDVYDLYKNYLDDTKNIFMKMTVFKDISFDNFDSFKESLRDVKEKLEKVTSKITLPEDITVFRVVSVPKDKELSFISKSEIISTSFSIDECSKFLIPNSNNYLYQINLKQGSSVAICPYSILINQETHQLSLTQKTDQKKVIISKSNYDFFEILSTDTKTDTKIIIVDALQKSKTNSNVK